MFPAGAPEAVAESGEEERSGFAGHASEGQENGGDDAAIGSGDDHRSDGFPFAGAQSHGAFAEFAGDGLQELFGASQGDRDHHERECEGTG